MEQKTGGYGQKGLFLTLLSPETFVRGIANQTQQKTVFS